MNPARTGTITPPCRQERVTKRYDEDEIVPLHPNGVVTSGFTPDV